MRVKFVIFALVAVIVVAGCVTTDGDVVDNETERILLSSEESIPEDLCEDRGLNDKIIMLESKYCGACKVAHPRLEEAGHELGADIIYLDLSVDEDKERMKEEFRVAPQYTPTVIVGCQVLIGGKYSKEEYVEVISDFLESK